MHKMHFAKMQSRAPRGVRLFCCRCAADKGEDAEECKFFQRSYRSLCPGEWVRVPPAHGQS